MSIIKEDINNINHGLHNNSKLDDDELSSYKDEYIDLNFNGLTINKYYIPFLTSKFIPINKIKNIQLFELSTFNGKYRLMGMSWPLVYFHFDSKRANKTHSIIIEEEDNLIKIAITPNNPSKCFKVLKYLKNHIKNNEIIEPILKEKDESEFLVDGKEKRN